MHFDHDHSHDHPHDHSHSHDDGGGHEHCCGCGGGSGTSDKDLALLKYMLEHNKQHARELNDIGGRVAGSGAHDAAKLIDEAVHYFDHANESLEKALYLVEGGDTA